MPTPPPISSAVSLIPQAPPGEPVCVTGVHPAAALFPLLQGDELSLLVDDIAKNGLREPILLHEGLLLDGRNRLHACELANVAPRFVEWQGEGSPLALVLSLNLHRRHLDESQRSLIAVRAKELFKQEAAEREHATRFGGRRKNHHNGLADEQKPRISSGGANLHRPERSNAKAAAALNVSARLVAVATRVVEEGDEQLVEAVREGEVTVSDASSVLDLPKERQREAVARVRSGDARTVRQAAKQLTRSPLDDDAKPALRARELRRACQRFTAGYERLFREIENAAWACGPNAHTPRAHEALTFAQCAMQACLAEFGRPARPK